MSIPVFQDPSFETPSQGDGGYTSSVTGSPWTFANGAGLTGPSSPYTSGNNIKTSDGTQVAFLQNVGSVSQAVNFDTAGVYTVSVQAQQRSGQNQTFEILVDGNLVGTFCPQTPNYTYGLVECVSNQFTVTTGSHTISFTATNTNGGDNTVFLDSASIQQISVTPVSVTPPRAPTLTISTANNTDTISYTASTAGTNPIAGYELFVGSTAGGETTTPVMMNSGAGAGSFTNAAGGNYYTIKAYDNATPPNSSASSNEVQGGAASSGGVSASQVQSIIAAAISEVFTGPRLGVLDVLAAAITAAGGAAMATNGFANLLADENMNNAQMNIILNNLATIISGHMIVPTVSPTAISAAVLGANTEPSETVLQTLRLMRAVLAGKCTDANGVSTFYRPDETTAALVVDHDTLGNRTLATVGNV